LTYGTLVARVDAIARGLSRRGVGRGHIVAIALPRSADLVVAILSVMASGAACAVLDASWPENRRERVLADAHPACTITDQPTSEGTSVSLDLLTADGRGAPACPPPPGSAVAYVIYTSGSTGQPKGVHVTHTNVLSLLAATGPGLALGPHDVWSLFHSCSFDVAMYEMFGCLLHGGQLVVVPGWTTRDPEAFADLLTTHHVTILSLTPSAMSMLLPQVVLRPAALAATRYILLAGEKLENRLADQWHREVGEQATLVNLYGITETTVHASWHLLSATEQTTTESNVGVPLPGTNLYLLRDDGTTAADGCVGEIYVGGPQVSLGYVGRPREVAARFVPDPFTPDTGARMYRSGDLGRRVGDHLTYLRRRDTQVQVNGFRVELAEVE
ncbi:MAG: amino acid adenylation domain-containing protein, partial [Propionibacteriaceae bacterium]|nr:amino acid adenylation domain-containing protein [Propionibacteriaceae bacterium]